jgi:hypothetical protein
MLDKKQTTKKSYGDVEEPDGDKREGWYGVRNSWSHTRRMESNTGPKACKANTHTWGAEVGRYYYTFIVPLSYGASETRWNGNASRTPRTAASGTTWKVVSGQSHMHTWMEVTWFPLTFPLKTLNFANVCEWW